MLLEPLCLFSGHGMKHPHEDSYAVTLQAGDCAFEVSQRSKRKQWKKWFM